MSDTPEPTHEAARLAAYWRRTLRLTGVLMAAGFIVTFVGSYFAPALAGLTLFGWPLPFLMAARGSLLVYVLIVCLYAWRMRALDRDYHESGRQDRP